MVIGESLKLLTMFLNSISSIANNLLANVLTTFNKCTYFVIKIRGKLTVKRSRKEISSHPAEYSSIS